MTTTYEQLSTAERAQIEAMVRNQIASLDAVNQQIVFRTQQSLAYYVANAIKATAAAFGYMIALPLAYAEMMVGSFVKGFGEGWDDAFAQVRKAWNS